MARKSRKHNNANAAESKVYKTAIYARLSQEAEKQETIETQVDLIKAYIRNKPCFQIVEIYMDNGYSGTNFLRPAFERMMEDVRNQKIDCIIVKDLSRFAREHIGAEDYLNNIFPFLGVRFIAIHDNYDNLHIEPQEYFLASFKNLAHAYFAMETSRKTCMAKKVIREQGKYAGAVVAYGYMRDPADKHSLIPDPEKVPIIRAVFEMAANNVTVNEIVDCLNQKENPDRVWTYHRIYAILKSELYKGVLVQHKRAGALYKNEKDHPLPKEEHLRSAVPPIVSPELWERANTNVYKRKKSSSENPYQGFIFCDKCGRMLNGYYHKNLSDFDYNCTICKCKIYTRNLCLNQAVRSYLGLDENTVITRELLEQHISGISVKGMRNLIIKSKDGEEA